MRTKTKLKLMTIITEKVTDFINNDVPDIYKEEKDPQKMSEGELEEFIEGIRLDEELGFKVIKEMRRSIKSLIKKGLDEEY
jgi:hypothetical protein|tara:strand:- start:2951 stop:3193 length:243 start_codon:yes stop_codon:yes gene_type:complete